MLAPDADILASEADVLAPCARGGVIGISDVPRLRVKIICAGANNPLAASTPAEELAVADRLHAARILYVPDWISNAGGAIHGTLEHALGPAFDPAAAASRARDICGSLTTEVLALSASTGRPPLLLALKRFA
jgi:glutamate dehydrogenase/leucine dehydrogenase